MAKFNLKEYARRGAQARVAELQTELTAIFRAFPDLRVPGPSTRRSAAGEQAAGRTKTPRRRRKMSAAQKKAVSARMKKFWAERKKAKTAK